MFFFYKDQLKVLPKVILVAAFHNNGIIQQRNEFVWVMLELIQQQSPKLSKRR